MALQPELLDSGLSDSGVLQRRDYHYQRLDRIYGMISSYCTGQFN